MIKTSDFETSFRIVHLKEALLNTIFLFLLSIFSLIFSVTFNCCHHASLTFFSSWVSSKSKMLSTVSNHSRNSCPSCYHYILVDLIWYCSPYSPSPWKLLLFGFLSTREFLPLKSILSCIDTLHGWWEEFGSEDNHNLQISFVIMDSPNSAALYLTVLVKWVHIFSLRSNHIIVARKIIYFSC